MVAILHIATTFSAGCRNDRFEAPVPLCLNNVDRQLWAETTRDRLLYVVEIQRLDDAVCADPDQRAAEIIRLCMLTGAHCGEARTATFDQFNLDLVIWAKQAAYIKQRRVHRVPISHEAVALIRLRRDAVPKGVLSSSPVMCRASDF